MSESAAEPRALTTLELLEEVEGEVMRLRAKNRRLTTSVEELREQVEAFEKQRFIVPETPQEAPKPVRAKRAKPVTKVAAKAVPKARTRKQQPPRAANQAESGKPAVTDRKRQALGRGLVQFFERSHRH